MTGTRAIALAAVLPLLLAGCASLRPVGDATKYPAGERAVLLNGTKVAGGLYVGVFGIDGDHRWRGLKPTGFLLSPGEHDFTVQLNNFIYDGINVSGSVTLRCWFEPGKTYSIQTQTSGTRFRAWIRDEQTRQEQPCRQ
ncbi:MAG: hypothetical protein ABWX93_08560 [Pseudoxanthomonas sp.]